MIKNQGTDNANIAFFILHICVELNLFIWYNLLGDKDYGKNRTVFLYR